MNEFVDVTDRDWFELLQRIPGIDEVNFWQLNADHVLRMPQAGIPVDLAG